MAEITIDAHETAQYVLVFEPNVRLKVERKRAFVDFLNGVVIPNIYAFYLVDAASSEFEYFIQAYQRIALLILLPNWLISHIDLFIRKWQGLSRLNYFWILHFLGHAIDMVLNLMLDFFLLFFLFLRQSVLRENLDHFLLFVLNLLLWTLLKHEFWFIPIYFIWLLFEIYLSVRQTLRLMAWTALLRLNMREFRHLVSLLHRRKNIGLPLLPSIAEGYLVTHIFIPAFWVQGLQLTSKVEVVIRQFRCALAEIVLKQLVTHDDTSIPHWFISMVKDWPDILRKDVVNQHASTCLAADW